MSLRVLSIPSVGKRWFCASKLVGVTLATVMLAGCSSIWPFNRADEPAETPQQALQVIPSRPSPQQAAQSDPKQIGQQVCKSLPSKLWGEFIMVGKVDAIGEDYLMKVDLDRVQLKGQPKMTQNGFPKNVWAMQNEWYECQDPV